MSDRIAVGLIGCGFFAQNHLHSWRDLKPAGADLIAVCDVDPAKAEAAAKTFGVPHWYESPEVMLDEQELSLVDVVTRMETHRPLVELALARAIPTIVQKPFAPDIADCRLMTQAAERAGRFLAVHENFRFQAPMRKARELIASGAIGAPSWARISFRTGYDIYSGQPYLRNERRFVIVDLGVHILDLARVFLGEVDTIFAQTQRRNRHVSGEDTATMLLRHSSGAVSVVECAYESRRVPDVFPETLVEIEGERGAIAVRPGYKLELTVNGEMREIDVDAPLLKWAERPWHAVQESVFATCAHMLGAVKAGRPAETSARDNLRTFALCEAAYASAETGVAVKPES